jgi:hypothetical protein
MDVQKEISLRNAIGYCIENNDANTATNRIMEFIRVVKVITSSWFCLLIGCNTMVNGLCPNNKQKTF